MLIMVQHSIFVAMLHDISENRLFPLLFKTTSPFCMHQVLGLHRHLQSVESAPLDQCPNKVSPGSVLSLISHHSFSSSNGIFISLIDSVPPLLCFLSTLIPLFCTLEDLTVTRLIHLVQKGALHF